VTAVTVLDDVLEAATTPVRQTSPGRPQAGRAVRRRQPGSFTSFLQAWPTAPPSLACSARTAFESNAPPATLTTAGHLAMLTYPCGRPQIERAAAGCGGDGKTTSVFRALEPLA
jgi:hypothetical protein